MSAITINETIIRVDSFGRLSLTDLWKASGSRESKRPYNFQNTESFDSLNEILKGRYPQFEPLTKTRGKYSGGTWAVKELVYAYGMYVSAEFMLKVIDVFDAAAHGDGVKAVAIAQGNEELKAMIDERDILMLSDPNQQVRDRIEILTSQISKEVKPMAQGLNMLRGKGKNKALTVINEMNQAIQLDMFAGKL